MAAKPTGYITVPEKKAIMERFAELQEKPENDGPAQADEIIGNMLVKLGFGDVVEEWKKIRNP